MTSPTLTQLPYDTDTGFGSRARIGLIVLESDQTIEAEARLIDLDGVAFYHSRIEMEDEVTPETLTAMEVRLPAAARLLPGRFDFDAIGYGCTSAATLIGADGVTAAIRNAHPAMACTNPISAAVAAFTALGSRRVAIVTPYTADVTAPIVDHFQGAGLEVSAVGSFLEPSDHVVARISESSIADGVRAIVAEGGACDAVFVSCTSLRVMHIAAALEQEIGVPVVSSNIALFWHLLRLAGITDNIAEFGSLFAHGANPARST